MREFPKAGKRRWFHRHRRKVLALVFAVSLLVALVLGECLLQGLRYWRQDESSQTAQNRLLYAGYPEGLYTYRKNAVFPYVNEDGAVIECRSDRYGLRNPNSIYDRSEPLILMLGDSFLASINTPEDQTLPRLLENRLRGFRVVNGGIDGFGTLNMYRMLVMFLDQGYRPGKVMVCVYMGNDFRDNYHAYDLYRHLSDLPNFRSASGRSGRSLWEMLKSPLRKSELVGLVRGATRKNSPFESYFLGELECYKNVPDAEFRKRSLEVTNWCFQRFGELADEGKFDLYVVLIPSKAQVYEELLFTAHFGTGGYDADKQSILDVIRGGHDLAKPEQDFVGLLRKHEIRYCSLTLPFRRQVNQGTKLYYQFDRHWNSRAQMVAVDYLVESFELEPAAESSRVRPDAP